MPSSPTAKGPPPPPRTRNGLAQRERPTTVGQLRAHLPGVRLSEIEEPQRPLVTHGIELRLNTARRSLRSDISETVTASLLTAMTGLRTDEALVLQWLVGPWLPRPVVKRTGTMREGVGPERLVPSLPLDNEDAAALKAKFSEPLFGVVGRIAVAAADSTRRQYLVQRVAGSLQLARNAGVGLVGRWIGPRRAARRLLRLQRPLIAWPCPLNAAELTALLSWPIGNPVVAGVEYRGGRQLAPARAVLVSSGTATSTVRVVGQATFPGQEKLLQLRPGDALHHLHVIGPTGAGKSTALGRLIEADLQAGRGLIVIEPKADLIAHVIDRIPAHRLNDVVVLDPTDRDTAVGLNVLAPPEGNIELAVDQILHLLYSLYKESWGPRTADVLHSALLTLGRHGGMTLCELPPLLTNAAFRRSVLATSPPDPLSVGSFWHWFQNLSDAERAVVTGPSLNKLRAFTDRRAIRSIIGQPHARFRLEQVFSDRKVLLINLAKGLIGPEAARLLGSLVLASLWQTALGRSAVPAAHRPPVMVYIDEFQDYVHGLPVDMGEVLAQARGLGVGMTLAHQLLGQLDKSIREAVSTNARSRIVFQTGSADGKALALSLGGGLTAPDLQALPRFEAYAVLMANAQAYGPMSLRTLPSTPALGTAREVRGRSRAQWGRPVVDVDQALLKRRTAAPAAPPGGRRPRRSA
ncbi:MAG: type IV secretory system conjugative DNA transfer family protein [Actinobacteria bacterium]|nr:type IV secretory system conjugative DNA transfer family protein [Actinomycetota bacterium]